MRTNATATVRLMKEIATLQMSPKYATVGMLALSTGLRGTSPEVWRRIGVAVWIRVPDRYAALVNWIPIIAVLDWQAQMTGTIPIGSE